MQTDKRRSPVFQRYIGIDYSGARTPKSSLKGLRVYVATPASLPVEVCPPLCLRRYWTRRGVAEWPVETVSEPLPTLVGIDHAFSFSKKYSIPIKSRSIGVPSWTIFAITGPLTMNTPGALPRCGKGLPAQGAYSGHLVYHVSCP